MTAKLTLQDLARLQGKATPKADPKRQAQGRRAHAQGDALEAYLLSTATRAGLYLAHVPTPVQITHRTGRTVTARLEAPVAPDFLGALPGGRLLALEAKSTTEAGRRWTLPDRLRLPDALHPDRGHQGRELLRVRGVGGAACVFVRAVTLGVDHLVPVGLEGGPDLAAPSWTWESLETWRVPSHGRWWEGVR